MGLEQVYVNQLWKVLSFYRPQMSDIKELYAKIHFITREGEKEKEKWNCEPNKYRAINLWLLKTRLKELYG